MIFKECNKQESRAFLFNSYEDKFKRKIERNKQYWTLSAECVKDSKLIDGTELSQLLKSKIITPSQFHGVDNNKSIVDSNKKFTNANWYFGDFYNVISREMKRNSFNPAIIHYDSMVSPKKAVPYLIKLMKLLRNYDGQVMLASNIALQWRWGIMNNMKVNNLNDIVGEFAKDRDALNGWNEKALYRSYVGSKVSKMGTIVFFKE